jgi:hypothetical protein
MSSFPNSRRLLKRCFVLLDAETAAVQRMGGERWLAGPVKCAAVKGPLVERTRLEADIGAMKEQEL